MKAVIKIFIIAALFFSSMTAWALRAENFSSPDLNAHNSTVVLFTGEGIVTGSATSSFNSGFDFSREETAGKEDDADYLVDFVFVSNEGVNLGNEGSTSLNSTGRRFLLIGTGDIESVTEVAERTDASPWVTVSWDWPDGTQGAPISVGQLWGVYTREGHYAVMEITGLPDGGFGTSFTFDYKYQPDGSRFFDGGGSSDPEVVVTSPTSASNWEIGTSQFITWESTNVDAASSSAGGVNLYYNTGSGDVVIAENVDSPDGENSYEWTVTGSAVSTAQIRVEADQDAGVFDLSDEFTISPQGDITILSPIGTEEKKFGETLTVSWQNNATYLNSNYFYLHYRVDGGSWYAIAQGSGTSFNPSGNQMSYNWTLPDLGTNLDSDIEVRVWNNSQGYYGYGAAFRLYFESSLVVDTPTGAEEKKFGQTQLVEWTNGDHKTSDYFYLQYRVNGGSWYAITQGSGTSFSPVGNQMSYNWTLPDLGTNLDSDIEVRVWNNSRNVEDISSSFRLYYESSLAIDTPTGAEEKKFGQTQLVEWTNGDHKTSDYFYLQYRVNGGSWYAITQGSGTSFSPVGNQMSYNWTLPDLGTNLDSDIEVRVWNNSRNVEDISSSFRLYFESSLAVDMPTGTEEMKFGQTQLVEWTNGDHKTSDYFYLQYRVNGGSWYAITQGSGTSFSPVGNQMSYNWTLPDLGTNLDSDIEVRVWNNSRNVEDISSPFRLYYESSVSITSPLGGEYKAVGSPFSIVWENGDHKTSDYFYIYYRINGGSWLSVAQGSGTSFNPVGNVMTRAWTIPNPGTGVDANVQVRVWNNSRNKEDISNSFVVCTNCEPVALSYPNGGESFFVGDEVSITWALSDAWNSSDNIELSYNAGAGDQTIFSGVYSAVPGDSYVWTVPDDVSSEVKVKITNTTTADSDESDSFFSIVPIPVRAVEFSSPSGDVVYLGGSVAVEFLPSEIADTDVLTFELSTNGGVSFPYTIQTGALNTLDNIAGSYFFDFVPTNASFVSESCMIRAKYGTTVLGASDIFYIASPAIYNLAVSYPQEGENVLVYDLPVDITFTNDGLSSFDIYYIVPGQSQVLIEDAIDISSDYNVTYSYTPDFVGENAKFRIVGGGQTIETETFDVVYPVVATDEGYDPVSLVDFGIRQAGSTTVLSYLLNVTNVGVTVTSTNPDDFEISLSDESGFANSLVIAPHAGIRSIPVYVKFAPATNNGALSQGVLRNRFVDSNLSNIDIDVNVQGRAATSGPSLVLFAPADAVELISNSVTTIRWGSTLVDLLSVEYSLDAGANWFLIEDDLSASFTEFDWLVPEVASQTDAIIRLVDQSGVATIASAEVSILPAPSIASLTLINIGADLQIDGSGFSSIANHNQIIFPGFPDITAYPTSASATQLVVEVPQGAVSGFIKVNVSGKGTAISPDQLVLSGVTLTPSQGQVGNTIFINGSGINFEAATSVSVTFTNGILGSVAAASVVVESDDLLSVVVPSGVEATGAVEVDVDGTVYTSAQAFKIQSIDFTPKTAGIFETVTISGVNTSFLNNNTQVFINGLAATASVVSNTQINVTVPQGASTGKVTVSTNNGFFEASGDLTVEQHKITSLSATKITKGQSLVITGDNFTGASSVKINGESITYQYYYFGTPYFTIDSDQQITVHISPSSIAGTGKVSVTKGGVEVESAEDLTVIPAITSLSTLQAAPGAQVTIYGSYFSSVDNTVYFNQNKPAAIVSQNSSSVTVIVPQGAIDGSVTVVNNDVSQQGVSSASFDVVAAPVFTSFSPLKATSGQVVTITGQNFQSPAPSNLVVNGNSVTFSVVDNNTIQFTVPTWMYGAGKVEITKGGVTVEGPQQFTVLPKITSFTLATGAVEGASVSISGTGFNPTASNNLVTFYNNKTATISSGNSTFLNVIVPSGAVTGKLRVSNQSILETAESASDFIVVPHAIISSFAPASGQVTKTEVTITGEHFSSPAVSAVRFSGTNATFSVISDTEIKATVPSIFSNGVISITRAGETVTSTNNFEIAPDITSLSASTLASGATLNVGGTFLNAVSQVKVGNTVATIISNNHYYGVSIAVPAMTPGNYKVTVTKNGLSDESDAELTVVAPHTITNFTQVAGLGQDVTITGTNFTSPAVTAVTLNGVSAAIQSTTATQLVVKVPNGMNFAGQGKVAITRAGLIIQSTSDFYVRHGISTTFNTQNYVVDQQITVSGNNFYYPSVSQVKVNGVNATFSIAGDGSLSVTIPNAVGTGKVEVIKPSPVGTVESTTDITIVPRAVLSSFSPTIQTIGGTVTLTGQNFTSPAVSSVTINNTSVSSFTVNSATEITVTVPNISNFNTQGNVQITRAGLTQSLGTFTVKHTFGSLSASTVTAGASVTVNGTFFTTPSATVTLGGTSVSVSSISANSLTFTVPTNTTPGSHEIVLTRLGEQVSAGNITVLAPHTIASFDSDRKGKAETLTITGSNFDNTPQVYLNDVLVSSTVNSSTEISLTVPSNIIGGTVSLRILRAGLTVSAFDGSDVDFSGTAQFYMKPSVTTDVAASTYVIGQTLTLSGSNFSTPGVNSVVLIDGGNETTVQSTVLSDNALQLVLTAQSGPALTAASYDVKLLKTVTSAEGNIEVTLANQLTLDEQATITEISEASAPAGAFVTITGSGFTVPDVSSVKINGASVGVGNFTVNDDNTITAKVPMAAAAYADGTANNIELVRGGLTIFAMDEFIVEQQITGFLKSDFSNINPATERVVEGQTIYIEGNHFESLASISSVTVNDVAVTPVFVNGNRLQLIVPAGSQGVGKVAVTRRSILAESAHALIVSPAASITELDPAARIAGGTITISGDHFSLPDVTTVTVNGAAATFDILNDDNIKATVPSNAAATGNVTVTRGGVTSNAVAFSVVPKIFSFTNTGLEGSIVTINGSHFGSTIGTNEVYFTGASGFVQAIASSANNNSLTVTVPVGTITGPIKVINTASAQQVVSSANFNLLPSPGSLNINPASGPVASQFTISGVNMNGANEVKVNGVSANSFTVDPDGTSITVTVPSSATSGEVVIKKAGQSFTAGTFNVTPKVISFPALAVVGSQITINGKTFTGATSVTINNTAATIDQISSDFVKVTTVAGNVGIGNIVVTTPSGSGTSSSTIEVKGQPSIASFSPALGGSGDVVTISGANLSTVTFVKFNNTNASFTVFSDNELSAIVPSGASTGKISLGLGGITVQSVGNFSIVPKITTFTAAAIAGATIQINGTNFSGATQVAFAGATAVPFSVSASSLSVTVPANAATGSLTVTTPSGTSAATANSFVVLPSISSGGFSPAKGAIGSTLMITGAGFVAADASLNVVNFNGGVTATASAATASGLTVQVPEGAMTGALTVTVNGTTTGPFSTASFVIVPQIDAAGLSIDAGYGGESLTITGKGFSSIAANNTVNFGGGVSAVPFSATTTSLGVTVPAGFATGAITVTSSGEASAPSTQIFIRKSVLVTAPNGGEVVNLGDVYPITWTSTGLDDATPLTIGYSTDGGASYTEIATGVVGDFSGTFDWAPEGEPTTAAKIKVTVDGDKASDESDDDFTVRIKPLLTVVYPNGGETVRFGKPAKIEFTTEGLEATTSLLFEYSLDNGTTYQELGVGTIGELAGVYDLVMVEEYSDEALVRISTETGEAVIDVSDQVFTSLPRPVLAITSPTEDETLFIGGSYDVTWTAQYLLGSDELELLYSADGGKTFSSKGSGLASQLAGKMTITADNAVTQEAQFKLVNADNDISATSATFSVVPAPSIVVTSPESGEILTGGVAKQITWTTTSVDPSAELVVEYSADGGATYESLTSGTVAALNGTFEWSVPNAATASGFVRVRIADGTVSDTNDQVFVVQAQVTSLSISGLLVTPGGSDVNVAEVLLYKANAAGGWDIVSTDELILAENRNTFSFVNLEPADYLIFAKPDRARFPNLRNTWFGNTLLVREAVTLSLSATRSDVDIEVVEVAPAPTGRGVVRGKLVNTSGNSRVSGLEIGRILDEGDPLAGVTVNLLNAATGAYVTDAETDENGLFTMSGLVVGQYMLSVELAGVPMDFGSAVIDLVNETDQVALTAIVTEDGTVLVRIDEVVAGINDPLVVERLVAYPMPVQNELTLEVSNKKAGDVKFVIFNLAGLQVFESQYLKADKGDHQWIFDVSHLKNGMYMGKFVKAETDEILPYQIKVMIAK
ncbi:MAG: IPT/TIG domain-containing protein [Imperialibacter sp.]|uniref:IPT/TIG domain-containing protein n=1 Tax=Imperialibacter sp. TaxID=2038411 RepID=UPI0032F07983